MLKIFQKVLFAGLLFRILPLAAQDQQLDTLVRLQEVSVLQKRLAFFNTGSNLLSLDSEELQSQSSATLRDALLYFSPLQTDAYGLGSASISGRGLGSKRTPVLWNGFNLQAVMGAEVDVSTIPLFFIDNVKVEMGGNAALFGSGAAGGVVYLSNELKPQEGTSANLETHMGSYGRFFSGAGTTWSNKNYAGSLRMYYEQAENDFAYQGTYVDTRNDITYQLKGEQTNAASRQYGLMSNNDFKLGNGQHIKANFWIQDVSREIAPTLSDIAKEKVTDAEQIDRVFRSSAEWAAPLKQGDLTVRSGLFVNTLDYYKPSAGDTTNSKGMASVSEAEVNLRFDSFFRVNAGINHTYERGESDSYGQEIKSRNRSAAFVSQRFYLEQIGYKAVLNGRIEQVDGNEFPVTWSFGAEKTLPFNFLLKGKIASNYRVPSFNDLYWVSAYSFGNPDLKPEKGMSYEAGFQWENR